MKKSILLCCFFFCVVLSAQAQDPRRDNYWSLGGQINATNYFGDLNPLHKYTGTRLDFTRPGLAFNASKKLSKHFHLRGSLSWIRLRGDDYKDDIPDVDDVNDVGRWGRNLHFRNSIWELAFTAQYDILKSEGRFYRRRYINPYLFAGVAGFYHNPKAKAPEAFGGDWVALRPLNTEGRGLTSARADVNYGKQYSLIQIAVPVGIGVKFRLSDRLDLSFESGIRILFTDHIDDVSGTYADIDDLKSDLAKAMFDRSAEGTAAVSGDDRNGAITGEFGGLIGGITPNYGGDLIFPDETGTPGFNRRSGYGLHGQPRGNGNRKGANGISNNDIYLVTGFHFNYILTTRRHPRYRQR
jgi:hypothetical protein